MWWCTDHLRPHTVLKNPVYKGETYFNRRQYQGPTATYKDQQEWIPIAVPPIVSKTIFERAQNQLVKNSAFLVGAPGTFYLLKGLLQCECGRRMVGMRAHHKRTKRDYVYRHYRCNGRGETGECRAKAILADRVEGQVWDAVVGILKDPETLFLNVKKRAGQLNAERVDAASILLQAEKDLAAVQKKRGKLLDLYLSDGIEKRVFETRDVPLKKEEDKLLKERDAAKALVAAGAAESSRRTSLLKQCKLILQGLDKLDDESKRVWLQQLVEKVLVSEKGLEIHGVFFDGAAIDGEKRPQSDPIVLAAAYPAASRSSRGAAKRASSCTVATTGMAGQSWGRGAPPRKRTTGRS
jgi:site-specific DNA recombinase